MKEPRKTARKLPRRHPGRGGYTAEVVTTALALWATGATDEAIGDRCEELHGERPSPRVLRSWGEASRLREIREANQRAKREASPLKTIAKVVEGAGLDALSQQQGELAAQFMGWAGKDMDHVQPAGTDAKDVLVRAEVGLRGARIADLAKPKKLEVAHSGTLNVRGVMALVPLFQRLHAEGRMTDVELEEASKAIAAPAAEASGS